MRKIVVVAGNHDEWERFAAEKFVYVGSSMDLEKIDPANVQQIIFVGSFRDHPLYFSNALLNFQFAVAAAKSTRKVEKPKSTFRKVLDFFYQGPEVYGA